MYSAIYRKLRLFWPGGLETQRHLQELVRTQWLSEDELESIQLTRIQRLVKHAYDQVPFYRERYQRAGIRPEDVKTLEDFQAVPFLTREDVQNNLDALVAQNFPRRALYANETGGSTGQPMRFFIEGSFWWWNAANVFRVRAWHGVHEGDRIAGFWASQQEESVWPWQQRLRVRILRERFLNAFCITEDTMRDFARMLVRWRPAMFKGYASSLCLFARFLKEQGLKPFRPRYIETTSEKLSGPQRAFLEDVFGCRVADHYSSREMGTMAYQCAKGGLHISADVRYVELVAGDNAVGPGQLGEVAVTSLNQFAMPFIRYKNKDMAIREADPCPCGRGLPLLKEVVGRTNDYLASADGQFVHSEFFAYLFRVRPEVIRYQIHQPDCTHLKVNLVLAQEVSKSWFERVRSEIQDCFGPAMQISFQIVDCIDLTPAGKHRYVISDVAPEFGQEYE